MHWADLREYVRDKAWAFELGIGLIAIFLTLTALQGLIWMSVAFVLFFLAIYPVVRTIQRWHLYGRGEKIFDVGMNAFMTSYVVYILVSGLTTKGVADLSSTLAPLGAVLIFPFTTILLGEAVPRWAKSRKKCPWCYRMTDITARACPCGHHWAPEAREQSPAS